MSAARVQVRLDARTAGSIAFLAVANRAKLNTLDRALMAKFIAAVEALGAREDLRAPSRPTSRRACFRLSPSASAIRQIPFIPA